MKLHLDTPPDSYIINACGDNFVEVNGNKHEQSLLLTAKGIVATELPRTITELSGAHLQHIADMNLQPEVFILGAGQASLSPKIEWLAPFASIGISLEVMSLSAACRTYNIMQGDGRIAVVILIL
ncbi:MAG: Mth938-like domain-containing protein [Gammaproteobacteria bacterium WSBS_2016_MAG_OTU1]